MQINNNYQIALTIDIEDWYHTPAITGSPFAFYKNVPTFMQQWNERYDYITTSTLHLLDVLKEYNLRATFFLVAGILDYYPNLMEAICDGGHEIACHGLDHVIHIDPKTKQPLFSIAEFEDTTGQAKNTLETKSGQKVRGYRAPCAYIGNWMFETLLRLGFEYDSSLNPNSFIKKTDYPIHTIDSSPFVVQTHNADTLYELPLPYWQCGPIKFPTGGGPYLRFMPFSYIRKGLHQSLMRGHTIFYFHSLDITREKLPLLTSKNSKRPFYFMTSGTKTERKLLQLLEHFHNRWVMAKEIIGYER